MIAATAPSLQGSYRLEVPRMMWTKSLLLLMLPRQVKRVKPYYGESGPHCHYL